jgi:hypothetical protein
MMLCRVSKGWRSKPFHTLIRTRPATQRISEKTAAVSTTNINANWDSTRSNASWSKGSCSAQELSSRPALAGFIHRRATWPHSSPRTWGELAGHGPMENAMRLAQQPVFSMNPHFNQGLAWQNVRSGNLTILDKKGGLKNTSTYIGFAPERKLGVLVLVNHGKQHATAIGKKFCTRLHKTNQSHRPKTSRSRIEIRIFASAFLFVSCRWLIRYVRQPVSSL